MTERLNNMIRAAQREGIVPASVSVPEDRQIVRIVDVKAKAPSIEDNVIKILNLCDPLQFLAMIVNGIPIPCYAVIDDEIVEVYEHPSVKQRIDAAKYLANKFAPNLAVTKTIPAPKEPNEDPDGFSAMVHRAADATQ